MEYIRFRSKYPNRHGHHVGIFGLVNVLGRNGMLTPEEELFRRENNDWYDAAYPDPYRDGYLVPAADPRAFSWFRPTSTALIERVRGYLAILDAHNVAWEEVRTTDPGTIVYSDEYQVVAVPTVNPPPDRAAWRERRDHCVSLGVNFDAK